MELLGVGIYTLREASRLSGVEPRRVRRWLTGYKSSQGHYSPLWKSQIETINGNHAAGFRDLLELRFIHFFLDKGVSLRTLKRVQSKLSEHSGLLHPFCSGRYVTDGSHILEDARDVEDQAFIDVLTGQKEFAKILDAFIHQLDFEGETAARWWPMGKKEPVVIDPERNFGHPIISQSGVETEVLAQAVKANGGSAHEVSRWYEIPVGAVEAALRYEASLAA